MAQMAPMVGGTVVPRRPHDSKRVVPKVVHTLVVERAVRTQTRSSYKEQRPFYTEQQHPTRKKLHKLQQRLAQQQRVERQRRRAHKSAHMAY